jgi:hypothetical protein
LTGTRVIEAGSLGIAFERWGDRLRHRVLRLGTLEALLLESIEGTASDDWPPSPPLQEVHVEYRAAGEVVALGVGSAGASYWSVSVVLDPRQRTATFDVACRRGDAAAWLGTTYRLGGEFKPSASNRLELSSGGVLQLHADANHPAALTIQADRVAIGPAERTSSTSPGKKTLRWKYVVGLS